MSQPSPIRPADEASIKAGVALLRAGQLLGLPTETVYGLAADARQPAAVAKIFAAKSRPADHPLIVHIASSAALADWAIDIPPAAYALALAFWPGPLTLILRKHASVPDCVTGGQATVGLRVPNHPVALAVLQSFGGGLAAPSANRFGHISPTSAAHVASELGDRVPLILDGGDCAVGIESTIVDLSRDTPAILRPGMISAAAIEAALQAHTSAANSAAAPRVSGALAAHYAPRTPMRLVNQQELQALSAQKNTAVLARQAAPNAHLAWQQAPQEAADYAHALYASLRTLDALGLNEILVEEVPADSAWEAIRDRLGRAQTGSGQDD